MSKNRGIALFTTLILITVLTMLLGSFVGVNQRQLHQMQNDEHREAAAQAARSALDYCLFRLERHRQWGTSEFASDSPKPNLASLKIDELKGTTRVTGKVLQSGAEFDVDIKNNLGTTGSSEGVPGGYIRLRITATRGRSTVRREALLGTAPIFDAGVVASDNVDISANSLTIGSTDPFRNRVRAKKHMKVPDYATSFEFDPADSATERGVLWAQQGITMGDKNLDNPAYAQEAAEQTSGQFLPKASTHHEIYDLQLDEVLVGKNEVVVESGVYVFNRLGSSDIPVLERRDWALNSDGELTGGVVEEVWLVNDGQFSSTIASHYPGLDLSRVHKHTANTFPLDTGVQVHFNSLDPTYTGDPEPPRITLNSDVNLVANGDFGITSASSEYDPIITFADPKSGQVGGSTSGAITALSPGDGKPGSIYLRGKIEGNGKLLASSDVTIRNTFANVVSDKASDLSIYAGGSVAIRPQNAKRFDEENEFSGSEEGLDGTTLFRGLVYAGKDVLFEANKDLTGTYDPGDITIEGAVVARDGSVTVTHANDVTFIYNPDYLDSILGTNTASRIRLEQVVWKEF